MISNKRSLITLSTLLFFYCLGVARPAIGFAPADSLLVYTLKENERIIYLGEHRLLVTNTGIGHLLFLSRANGYFILFNGKEYGPYESIGFTESAASLMDWAVSQGGKWFQLILDKGIQLGPYDNVVDVYRSYEYGDAYRGTDYTGNHYGFRARKGKEWYSVIDGKPYGPYINEPGNGMPHFNYTGGTLRAYLQDYDYDSNTATYKSRGDSVVLGKSPESVYRLTGKVFYKNNQPIKENISYFEEDVDFKNYLAIDEDNIVSMNGNKVEGCPPASEGSYGYYSPKPSFIHGSGHAIVLHKVDNSDYYYLTKQKISIGPFNDVEKSSLCFSRDANHYAYSKGTQILINGKVVHQKGFSLVHNPAKDSFSWLSVKGRGIYLHSLKP